MANYEATIEAQLGGRTVRYLDMVRFYFKSGQVRLHHGTGLLVDNNGEQWKGVGKLGRISPITSGPSGGADEITMSLFGDSEMLRHVDEDAEESAGQLVVRYLQFLDIRQRDALGNWVEYQPLDVPMETFRGRMGPLQIDRPPVTDPNESASRVVTVRAVNAFYNRRRPPFGYFSHRDQQARSPGDNLFRDASRMADAKVNWPTGLT